MTDYCIICETEPIEAKPPGMIFSWFREVEGTECICPWCVKDMHENKDHMRIEKIKAALHIYKEKEFSREFVESLIK